MATNIEWAEESWNPTTGCDKVTQGCRECYAVPDSWRLAHNPNPKIAAAYAGVAEKRRGKVIWTGQINLLPDRLDKPLRRRTPTRYFVNSMSDLFHKGVPFWFVDRVMAVIALCPQHTFIVLTKRPDRMRDYFADMSVARSDGRGEAVIDFGRPHHPDPDALCLESFRFPLPNLWAGPSVTCQADADRFIPDVLATPLARRIVSVEPMLGAVDFTRLNPQGVDGWIDALTGRGQRGPGVFVSSARLHGVICGGETGPRARPMHPDWPRALRGQCVAAGVPFFFKQVGEWQPAATAQEDDWFADRRLERVAYWPDGTLGAGVYDQKGGPCKRLYRVGRKRAGRLLDGREWNQMPENR